MCALLHLEDPPKRTRVFERKEKLLQQEIKWEVKKKLGEMWHLRGYALHATKGHVCIVGWQELVEQGERIQSKIKQIYAKILALVSLAGWPWTSYFTFLSLGGLICKSGKRVVNNHYSLYVLNVCHVPLAQLILTTNLCATTPILQKTEAQRWTDLLKATE